MSCDVSYAGIADRWTSACREYVRTAVYAIILTNEAMSERKPLVLSLLIKIVKVIIRRTLYNELPLRN